MDCVCVIHVAEALYCVSVHVSNLLIYIYHSKGLRGEHQYTVGLNKRTKKKKKKENHFPKAFLHQEEVQRRLVTFPLIFFLNQHNVHTVSLHCKSAELDMYFLCWKLFKKSKLRLARLRSTNITNSCFDK